MADCSMRLEKLRDSRAWPFKHLTVSIKEIALLATFEAWVSSACCAVILDFMREERNAMTDEKTGIPARVTSDRLQEV